MYEERRWGWYRVLDHTKYDDGNEVLTKRIGITASKNLSYQYHNNRSEVWTVVKGEGIFVLDEEIRVVRPGMCWKFSQDRSMQLKLLQIWSLLRCNQEAN